MSRGQDPRIRQLAMQVEDALAAGEVEKGKADSLRRQLSELQARYIEKCAEVKRLETELAELAEMKRGVWGE